MKIIASVLVMAIFVSAGSFAAQTYKVATTLVKNGELIASPVLVVEAGKEASVTMGSAFKYNLKVVPNSDNTATLSTALQSGETKMNPVMTVIYDQEATMQFDGHRLSVVVSKAGN